MREITIKGKKLTIHIGGAAVYRFINLKGKFSDLENKADKENFFKAQVDMLYSALYGECRQDYNNPSEVADLLMPPPSEAEFKAYSDALNAELKNFQNNVAINANE